MAVVTVKSTQITNRDSSPTLISNDYLTAARMHEATGVVAIGAADSATSAYIFCSIPSNARVSQVLLSTDAATGANMACTLGLSDTTANGGAVVKAAFFATGISTSSVLSASDVTCNNATACNKVSAGEQRVWEALGLSADPFKFYDVVLASTVNNSTTGANAKLLVRYTV